jgi:HAMP domain-containing protein
MDKLWTALLAASPFLGFLLWVVWWLITDSLNERRRARAAAQLARVHDSRPDEQDDEHGQTPAA